MSTGISFDYSGASVLVTGGSNGIGLAIARGYKQAGAEVMITGRRDSAEDYDHELGEFTYRQLDVNSKDAIVELASSLEKLDILVNNAVVPRRTSGGTTALTTLSISTCPVHST